MTLALSRQAMDFLWAGGAGILLGLLYDFGRALRRCWGKMTIPADMLFALCFFLSLLALSLYTGGLRPYQCLGIGLGAGGYFLTLSPILLKILGRFWGLIRALCVRLRRILKKSLFFLRKIAKKLFPSSGKSGTIFKRPFSPNGKRAPKGSAKPQNEKKHLQAAHRAAQSGRRMEFRPSLRRNAERDPAAAGSFRRHRRHGGDRKSAAK